MIDLKEIFSKDGAYAIQNLKIKSIDIPAWDGLLRDYEPKNHEVMDKTIRRDKTRKDGTIEKVARITISLEKLLVSRMTEFMFSIPVKRIYHNANSDKAKEITAAMERIYKHARIDTENIKRGKEYFASCEICTVWYVQEKQHTTYGFPCKYKLKCKTYSPMNGTKLYPLFDELGDLLAMSFEYKRKIADEEITFFETYTADKHYKWSYNDSITPIEEVNEPITLTKIPAVYAYRPKPIYDGLSGIRNEIEFTLSRNNDVIAYNAAPVLMVSGQVQGTEEKGESRRVMRVESGGNVQYVSWAQSTEAVKWQTEKLLNLYWTQSQMPDISFDRMSSLGNIGYDARQTLLTDAHLKVGDEKGAMIEMLERECSVVKEFLKQLRTDWATELDSIEVEHIISPFIQNDETATIDRLQKANGGKPVISHLDSIERAGYSKDPQQTLEDIQNEEMQKTISANSLFESAQV